MAAKYIHKTFKKDPDSTLDFNVNWEEWLENDLIIDSIWIISPSTGLQIESTLFASTGLTTVFVKSGTLNTKYLITNSITTQLGRKDDRTFEVIIVER